MGVIGDPDGIHVPEEIIDVHLKPNISIKGKSSVLAIFKRKQIVGRGSCNATAFFIISFGKIVTIVYNKVNE